MTTFQNLYADIAKNLKHHAKTIFAEILSECYQERLLLSRRERNNLLLNGQHSSWLRKTNSFGYWRRPEIQSAILFELINQKLTKLNKTISRQLGSEIAKKLFQQFQVQFVDRQPIDWNFQYDSVLNRFVQYDYPGRPLEYKSRADRLLEICRDGNHPLQQLAIQRFQYLPYGISRRTVNTLQRNNVIQQLVDESFISQEVNYSQEVLDRQFFEESQKVAEKFVSV